MQGSGEASQISRACQAVLSGQPLEAAGLLQARITAEPTDHEARFWLASAMLALGQPDAAAQALDDGRTLLAIAQGRQAGVDLPKAKSDPAYAADIAQRLYQQHQVSMASVFFGMALSAGRIDAPTLTSYGLSLQHQGRVEEAAMAFRAVADNFPSPHMHQFLLFPQVFCEDGDRRFFNEARAWADLYAPVTPTPAHANRARDGRRLRIGYVAPNFAASQLRQFITPLLESHAPERVSVVLYPADAGTEAGHWADWIEIHPIGALNSDQAAALIRSDGIDVLADCWGHTAGSRLQVFARRPAPVQIAWINFLQTTGLEQMDYVPHASGGELETAGLYTEQIWPIGPVFNAFRPAEGRLPPAPTPALESGQITFGSFNHPAKLSDPTIAAWAQILKALPTARLLLKYRYFVDQILQHVVRARFAAHGVAPEAIVFAGHTSGEAYFQSFRTVDLALDAWPAPGSTTTMDALSNGVPVLVLAGSPPTLAGLYSRSIVEACGLPELVAGTPEEFVERAVELTSDLHALDRLRARVRPAFENGACCDEVGFTRRVETAFEEMFDLWRLGPAQPRSATR